MNFSGLIPAKYRTGLLLAAAVAAVAFLFNSGRAYERRLCDAAEATTNAEATTEKASQAVASAEHDATAARADITALSDYVDKNLADQPPLRLVFSRIDSVCVHDGAAEDRVPRPVPGVAGLAEEAGGETPNSGGRTFVDDLKHDIAVCKNEFNRLDACAARLRWQDGEEQ